MTTYGEAASAGFGRLVDLWGDGAPFSGEHLGQGFWHAGNTLHACIEHLLLNPPPQAHPLMQASFAFFDDHRDKDPDPANWKFWRDDYGWWGRALLLGYQNAGQLRIADPDPWLQLAHTCWYGLSQAWDPDGGGCWNDPNKGPGSRRNSVTNELFFLLTMELAAQPGAPAEDYKGWAAKSRAWFLGFDQAGSLFTSGLVDETPGDQTVRGWIWTGDQGLYAACCAKAAALLGPADPPGTYPDGQGLVKAVEQQLFDGDGVLFESPSGQVDVDYATGKGVYFRNVADVASLVDPHAVLANAEYVWDRRPEVGNFPPDQYQYQFAYAWNPPPGQPGPQGDGSVLWDITVQTAGLDVLNAAARIAGDTEIPSLSS